MKKQYIFFTAVIMIFTANLFLYGQSKTGTTIGQFLKIEPGSRSIAMGTAGTSLYGEASSVYYNPASLGRLQGFDAQFTYNQWIADIKVNYAAAAMNIPSIGTFSLAVTSLSSGEIDVTTVDQPLGTGERYSVNDFALGLGYGLMLTDRVSVGVQLSYFQESIWHCSLMGFSMNFGVQYQLEPNGLTLGASVTNFGPRSSFSGRDLYVNFDFDPKQNGNNDRIPADLRTDSYGLPTTFHVGASYPIKISEDQIITVCADAKHPNDNNESINAGAEWNIMNMFFVRGGYRDIFLQDSEGGLVLGAGVLVNVGGTNKIRFDYAWADYGRLNKAHRFTVGISL